MVLYDDFGREVDSCGILQAYCSPLGQMEADCHSPHTF
jgi:hypothetical protein